MPNIRGILFDHAGAMTAIELDSESATSELYEHIGCKVVVPFHVGNGINVWIDAEGAANGQRPNTALSKTVEKLGARDAPLFMFGPGVFLAYAERGEGKPVVGLSNDAVEQIVLAQVRSTHPVTTTAK